MSMIGRAFQYPYADDAGIISTGVTTLKYSLLYVSTVLIIPYFLLLGYIENAMAAASKGSESMPDLEISTGYFIDGFAAFALLAIFLIPTLAVTAGLTYVDQTLGTLSSYVLLLGFYYVFPASLTEHGRTKSLKKAIDLRRYWKTLLTGEYFIGYVAGAAVATAFTIIGMLLSVTVIGIIFYPGAIVAGAFGSAYCIGRGYGNARTR